MRRRPSRPSPADGRGTGRAGRAQGAGRSRPTRLRPISLMVSRRSLRPAFVCSFAHGIAGQVACHVLHHAGCRAPTGSSPSSLLDKPQPTNASGDADSSGPAAALGSPRSPRREAATVSSGALAPGDPVRADRLRAAQRDTALPITATPVGLRFNPANGLTCCFVCGPGLIRLAYLAVAHIREFDHVKGIEDLLKGPTASQHPKWQVSSPDSRSPGLRAVARPSTSGPRGEGQ